jgi:hypothetical protein
LHELHVRFDDFKKLMDKTKKIVTINPLNKIHKFEKLVKSLPPSPKTKCL